MLKVSGFQVIFPPERSPFLQNRQVGSDEYNAAAPQELISRLRNFNFIFIMNTKISVVTARRYGRSF